MKTKHDARARRAVEMLINHFGMWETIRRIISCPDSRELPFDPEEALKLIDIQCGDNRKGPDDEDGN
jgi:hypothetical protein